MQSDGDWLGRDKERYLLFIITYFYIGINRNWSREGWTKARRPKIEAEGEEQVRVSSEGGDRGHSPGHKRFLDMKKAWTCM